jgi:pSer/pThr/pTyr-binding forkhead associated (FHA) protein
MNEPALELFRNACGLGVPLALDCEDASGSSAGSAICQFDYPFVLIGRDPRSDLILDDAQISRRHTFLQAVAGRILVVDLHSRTKILWEGEETPRSQGWLDQDRYIQVGPYRIRRTGCNAIQDQPAELPDPSSPLDEEPNGAGSVPRAALELPIRMGEGASLWPLSGRVVLVGRAAGCELVLTDDSVSRFHAALVQTPSGVWVVDLLAREGVHVNGERVRWAWLSDGDSFRMGSFTFILRYETPPNQITRRDVPLEAGALPVERPGTELAVPVAKPDEDRLALTVRAGGRSPVRLNATGFSQTLKPAPLVPSGVGTWDPSIPFPSNPMAMWQQQMQLMESFHNDMILMVQMFVAMHREHLTSVRHELDMVQQLTGELSDLQAKLAVPSSSADVGLTAGIGRTPRDSEPVQALNRKKRDQKSVSREPSDASNRPQLKSPQPAANPVFPSPNNRSAERSVPPESHDTGNGGDSQIHALLTERIAKLQRERQGYWQRILSALHN